MLANARRCDGTKPVGTETVRTLAAAGRVIAEEVAADRDYPPFARSARDGFAVRAADLPGELKVIGEVRAGEVFGGAVGAGEAVEIMTGAPMPEGADAVVMIEHTESVGDRCENRPRRPRRQLQPAGRRGSRGRDRARSRAAAGIRGDRAAGDGRAASACRFSESRAWRFSPPAMRLSRRARRRSHFQIRNSNAWSLAAQVERAGGVPEILPIARDNYESTRSMIERGSGCGSAAAVGRRFGREIRYRRKGSGRSGRGVFLRSGEDSAGPAAGVGFVKEGPRAANSFSGCRAIPPPPWSRSRCSRGLRWSFLAEPDDAPLPLLRARLTQRVPAQAGADAIPSGEAERWTARPSRPKPWQGSGDVAALARANAFLVAEADRESWEAGEDIRVLIR